MALPKRLPITEGNPMGGTEEEDVQITDGPTETIEISDDDEEDEPPPERPVELSRWQKRQSRLKEREAEIKTEADARVRAAEERARAVELELMRQRGQQEAVQALRQAQQPQGDPEEEEIKAARREQRQRYEYLKTLNGDDAQTQKLVDDTVDEINRLREREVAAIARKATRGMPQADPRQMAQQTYANNVLMEVAGDVIQAAQTNPNITRWGRHKWEQLIAEGYPDDRSTLELATESTRKQFGIKSRLPSGGQRPPPVQRQALSSMSAGGGGGGRGEGRTVEMTPAFKQMALARFPKDEPAVAYKKWAQRIGSKIKA